MEEKVYYIYETTCDTNNKKYIGLHHGYTWDSYLGSGKAFLKAVKSIGREHFHKKILEICSTLEEANQRERYYIDLVQADTNPNYYNLTEGGGCPPVRAGEANGMYGKHHSDESIELMRQRRGGRNPVKCITTGEVFISANEAARKYTSTSGQCIGRCCNGKQETAGKDLITKQRLVWEWYEGDNK